MKRNKDMYLGTTSHGFVWRAKRWHSRNRMVVSGIILCLVGLLACIAFPEDAMGGVFCVMLGIPVTAFGAVDRFFA